MRFFAFLSEFLNFLQSLLPERFHLGEEKNEG